MPLRQAGRHGWPGGDGLARLARPFPLTCAWIWEEGEPPPDPGITRNQVWNVTDAGAQPFGRSFGYITADGFAGWAAHWAVGKDWYDAPH